MYYIEILGNHEKEVYFLDDNNKQIFYEDGFCSFDKIKLERLEKFRDTDDFMEALEEDGIVTYFMGKTDYEREGEEKKVIHKDDPGLPPGFNFYENLPALKYELDRKRDKLAQMESNKIKIKKLEQELYDLEEELANERFLNRE
jgi:hypothetical protein